MLPWVSFAKTNNFNERANILTNVLKVNFRKYLLTSSDIYLNFTYHEHFYSENNFHWNCFVPVTLKLI
jgi:hypothetical protein